MPVKKESSWFDQKVPSSYLLVSGLLITPTILLQSNLVIKTLQILTMLFLCIVSKKQLSIVWSSLFFILTVIFNLLSPFGKIIVKVTVFPVTQGALFLGFNKGLNLLGLLYISRFSVRTDYVFPGSIGRSITKMFFYLHCLLELRNIFNIKDAVGSLDRLFQTVYSYVPKKSTIMKRRLTGIGILFISGIIVFNWGCVFLDYFWL